MSTATSALPVRAEHVGSLLRPNEIHAAREVHGAAQLSGGRFPTSSALQAIEDEAIKGVVAMQERVGLPVVTDGEYRRSFWHYDFMGALTGLSLVERGEGVQFQGATLRPIHPTISGRLEVSE